ncbi:unnamed protein product [Dibothriocephalus latus]|uniref:Uncharacterized protein n=1 Tax=Dibothriocephalus latus TaxID=60516 RepID=A0A3P7NFL0_DIBLA|nr:unnamed protein product [Dibothriocephalus latus]
MVLYRRILYYLEYVYVQVKKAVDNKRLKPTETAKRRLIDCNALYHRCYIRLCQLARQSRRDDLIEPVGRLLSRITANRLIFNHALDQVSALRLKGLTLSNTLGSGRTNIPCFGLAIVPRAFLYDTMPA